ncbi:MAG: universal stress protein, partial [Desulfosarcina sp.]|nr:universal stress protein [Desulfobacterales bacterium]
MFNKILVATDLLENCDPVVLVAAEIADQHKGMLHLIHILESGYSAQYRNVVKDFKTGEELVSNEEYETMVKEQIKSPYIWILKDPEHYKIRIRPGFPWEEILRWARKKKPELIVLGPHPGRAEAKGVTRVSSMVGSTIEGVITHERCPVMIVNRYIPGERL